MYPHHVFNLEPAGTFGMYTICYQWVSGGYIQPEPAMYSRCFHWFPGPLAPSAPYYAAQMKRCTQKWDQRDDQGASSEVINVSRQLIGIVGTGLYHSMAEVQATVGRTVDPVQEPTDRLSFLG